MIAYKIHLWKYQSLGVSSNKKLDSGDFSNKKLDSWVFSNKNQILVFFFW